MPELRPDEIDALKRDLIGFRADLEEPGVRAGLVAAGWGRILGTLELIPHSYRDKPILELGSSPYFLSLCLYRLCTGPLKHGNYFGLAHTHGVDRLIHQETGEIVEFAYDAFNIETDRFPYADGSFDVVVFSELIEHLAVNPVRALAEIHRVLRPDGIVIVTTPNALSMERFAAFLYGVSQMVDRYSPQFGYGARHNREYCPRELRELLEGTGFTVEEMATRDLSALSTGERLQRAVWRNLLQAHAALSLVWRASRWGRELWQQLRRLPRDLPRREHVFIRARRGERFRWYFPPDLFDNVQLYTLVQYSCVEMGINDSIQCGTGWSPLEVRPDGVELRWIQGAAGQAFLKVPEGFAAFKAEVWAAPGANAPARNVRVVIRDRWLGQVQRETVYADAAAMPEPGRWHEIELPIAEPRPRPGDEVEVMFQPASPRERGLAVRRFRLQ